MIHPAFPMKFFNEMHRILKKKGKLIIFDAHCSLLLQIVLILMKHEGFDFTKCLESNKAVTEDDDLWQETVQYLT